MYELVLLCYLTSISIVYLIMESLLSLIFGVNIWCVKAYIWLMYLLNTNPPLRHGKLGHFKRPINVMICELTRLISMRHILCIFKPYHTSYFLVWRLPISRCSCTVAVDDYCCLCVSKIDKSLLWWEKECTFLYFLKKRKRKRPPMLLHLAPPYSSFHVDTLSCAWDFPSLSIVIL